MVLLELLFLPVLEILMAPHRLLHYHHTVLLELPPHPLELVLLTDLHRVQLYQHTVLPVLLHHQLALHTAPQVLLQSHPVQVLHMDLLVHLLVTAMALQVLQQSHPVPVLLMDLLALLLVIVMAPQVPLPFQAPHLTPTAHRVPQLSRQAIHTADPVPQWLPQLEIPTVHHQVY